jgi:hypothetical protein
VEKSKARAKLKGEVKSAKGQKARTKNPSSQDPVRPQKVNAPEALKQSVTGQSGKMSEVKPSIKPKTRTQISDEIKIAATADKFSIRETDEGEVNTVKLYTKEEARKLAQALLEWAGE